MARPKGTPKTGGRGPNTPNRTSDEIRISLLKLLDKNLQQLEKDLKAMEPKERVRTLISLAKHVTAPAMNPDNLSISQLEQILQYLKDQNHG